MTVRLLPGDQITLEVIARSTPDSARPQKGILQRRAAAILHLKKLYATAAVRTGAHAGAAAFLDELTSDVIRDAYSMERR